MYLGTGLEAVQGRPRTYPSWGSGSQAWSDLCPQMSLLRPWHCWYPQSWVVAGSWTIVPLLTCTSCGQWHGPKVASSCSRQRVRAGGGATEDGGIRGSRETLFLACGAPCTVDFRYLQECLLESLWTPKDGTLNCCFRRKRTLWVVSRQTNAPALFDVLLFKDTIYNMHCSLTLDSRATAL